MLKRSKTRTRGRALVPMPPTPEPDVEVASYKRPRTLWFVINSVQPIEYTVQHSGGASVIETVAFHLRRLGLCVEFVACTGSRIQIDRDDIVIYSETVEGNPLRANKFIRWLLYVPTEACMATWGKDDVLVDYVNTYGKLASALFNIKYPRTRHTFTYVMTLKGGLPVPDPAVEKLHDRSHLIRKAAPAHLPGFSEHRLDLQSEYGICLDKLLLTTKIMNEIKKSKRIYFFDPFTFYHILAAASGCEVVIVPFENLSADEFRAAVPMCRYGIAYGDGELELEYARTTIDEMRDTIAAYVKDNQRQCVEFIQFLWQTFPVTC